MFFFHSLRNSTRLFQCLAAAMTHFLSFAIPPSFFKTFSYSVFNYLHFPIKFCLLMLHCFAPRRRNLKLKFQTHHTTSESEKKVVKTQTLLLTLLVVIKNHETLRRLEPSPALMCFESNLHYLA